MYSREKTVSSINYTSLGLSILKWIEVQNSTIRTKCKIIGKWQNFALDRKKVVDTEKLTFPVSIGTTNREISVIIHPSIANLIEILPRNV